MRHNSNATIHKHKKRNAKTVRFQFGERNTNALYTSNELHIAVWRGKHPTYDPVSFWTVG